MKDILVVEDNQISREQLEGLFKKAGYSVVACESASEAEEAVKLDEFRLAVLDIGLGDKSGSRLFSFLKGSNKVSFIMIYTGNPSGHLRQRFMNDGAVDYIVKGSEQASDERMLNRVSQILGEASASKVAGIPLRTFLSQFISEKSRALFYDDNGQVPQCKSCGGGEYQVVFSDIPQVPPEVVGKVVCSACGSLLDPEVK